MLSMQGLILINRIYLEMANHTIPVTGRYIDPLVDFAFKKIFGSEPNKDLLIAFLNEVFRGTKFITDLTYSKNEHPGELKDEGGAIFDLLCTGADGEQFLIEVQRGRQGNFKERALFYTSRLISSQAPKGGRNEWSYNLTAVYLIALLEDFTLPVSDSSAFIYDIGLCSKSNGEIFYDKLGFIYIELRKFVKTEKELENDLDRWLYILKNISRMNKIPLYFRKPIFEKLFSIAEYTNFTKEEKTMYDSSLKRKWDNKNVLDHAMSEGLQLGIQQGIEQGLEQGQRQKALEIAREMKKEGFTLTHISKFTKLSVEEIETL